MNVAAGRGDSSASKIANSRVRVWILAVRCPCVIAPLLGSDVADKTGARVG
jgi:hypothetical protein